MGSCKCSPITKSLPLNLLKRAGKADQKFLVKVEIITEVDKKALSIDNAFLTN